MKLSDVIAQLQNARAAHKAWVARAEALVAGMPLEKELVPVLPTDCIFGQWYYGSGQMLRRLPAYKALEKPHDTLHRTYMEIFKLLYTEPEVSALGKMFGKAKKLKAEQQQQAEKLIQPLHYLSEEVCDILETLEQQVREAAKRQQVQATINKTL